MSLSSQNMLVSFGVYILKKTIANKNCGVRKKEKIKNIKQKVSHVWSPSGYLKCN